MTKVECVQLDNLLKLPMFVFTNLQIRLKSTVAIKCSPDTPMWKDGALLSNQKFVVGGGGV